MTLQSAAGTSTCPVASAIIFNSNQTAHRLRIETCMGTWLWSSPRSRPRLESGCTCPTSIPNVVYFSMLFAAPRLRRRPSSGELHEEAQRPALYRRREGRRILDRASLLQKENSSPHKRRGGQYTSSTSCLYS